MLNLVPSHRLPSASSLPDAALRDRTALQGDMDRALAALGLSDLPRVEGWPDPLALHGIEQQKPGTAEALFQTCAAEGARRRRKERRLSGRPFRAVLGGQITGFAWALLGICASVRLGLQGDTAASLGWVFATYAPLLWARFRVPIPPEWEQDSSGRMPNGPAT